jgi:spermidine/putrescine transport system permease protein
VNVWSRRLLLAVPIAWVAVAHVGPLIAMLRISLLSVYPAAPDATPDWSASAYDAFLAGAGYRASLLHSLTLAGLATIASLLVAYPLAYHVSLHVPPARRGRRLMLLVAPFWASEVLRMFAVVMLLSNRGALNTLLLAVGVIHAPIQMLYGSGAVLTGVVYTVLLSMLLPLVSALDRLPRELLEAASDLGAGAWQRLWHVTLPLTARGAAAGIMLTFLASLGVFTAPALLGGTGTPVFASVIADLFGAASGRWPMGAAFGFILLVAGAACAAGLGALAPGLRRGSSG